MSNISQKDKCVMNLFRREESDQLDPKWKRIIAIIFNISLAVTNRVKNYTLVDTFCKTSFKQYP